MSCPRRRSVTDKPYFLPSEVVIHNSPADVWVTFLYRVLDLTSLAREYEGTREIKPILASAGKDVSHWFEETTGDIRHFIHPVTEVRVPYCPHGPVPHVGPQVPTTDWQPLGHPPWWFDPQYHIGYLTKKPRTIRIINVLTGHLVTITVCCEDKLSRILERFLPFNAHAASYTWKFDTRVLDMDRTLEENRIADDSETFEELGLPDDFYTPALLLYYNDDLTEL